MSKQRADNELNDAKAVLSNAMRRLETGKERLAYLSGVSNHGRNQAVKIAAGVLWTETHSAMKSERDERGEG